MGWAPISFPGWAPSAQLGHSPFCQLVSLGTWNSQGLFAVREPSRSVKMNRVVQLAESHDVVVVQETRDDVFRHRHLEFLLRHSHLCFLCTRVSSGRSGGCAIIMKKLLLNRFNRHYILGIRPGRGMLLRAFGDQGDLQLVCVCVCVCVHIDPAGSCDEQIAHVSNIASKIACCDNTAVYALGDFNFEIDTEYRLTSPLARHVLGPAGWLDTGAINSAAWLSCIRPTRREPL